MARLPEGLAVPGPLFPWYVLEDEIDVFLGDLKPFCEEGG